jgi:hypothetical protein
MPPVKTEVKRPVENTLRRIWLFRKKVSPMQVTAAMLKMADPCLKETLRMNKKAWYL